MVRTNGRELYDGRHVKTWIDIRGTLWLYDKDKVRLYKWVDGEWDQIPDELFGDMLKTLAAVVGV